MLTIYSCFVIYAEGIAVDVEIREGELPGAWFVGTYHECERWSAQYLNDLENIRRF